MATLSNGDMITFGQDQQPYIFQYSQDQNVRPAISVLDDKVSLVPKAYPTYARIDHLASPQISYQPKTAVSIYLIHSILKMKILVICQHVPSPISSQEKSRRDIRK